MKFLVKAEGHCEDKVGIHARGIGRSVRCMFVSVEKSNCAIVFTHCQWLLLLRPLIPKMPSRILRMPSRLFKMLRHAKRTRSLNINLNPVS